jgi:hypothetical protein
MKSDVSGAFQSLAQDDKEKNKRLMYIVIVKASSGPRYVVSYRPTLPAHKVSLSVVPAVQEREDIDTVLTIS